MCVCVCFGVCVFRCVCVCVCRVTSTVCVLKVRGLLEELKEGKYLGCEGIRGEKGCVVWLNGDDRGEKREILVL